MAKPPALVVSALATWNGKALTKGSKQISEFDKSAQKLGKTLTKYLGATALVAFGKSSVNAFIESEKAAAKLRTTVSNLGLSFEQSGIDNYLQKLSLQFGIVDESLIPGFQRLLIVTKDVAQAQSIFQTALDVSAGTGKDLTTVSTSLSKAYLGDNVALGRLGVGLSKAQLKSASFLEVQKTLNANFGGQASAAVAGYAGDMAKLTVAVDESKEAIGKGLLDAMKTLSGDTSIDTFTNNMIKSANLIAGAFNSIARFISTLIPGNVIKVNGEYKLKSELGSSQSFQSLSAINLTNKTTKARKDELAILTASNKARSEIDKLKDKFDLERIGLMTALNAASDEETKLRIKAQIAILDNNEALAKKYNAELEAANSAMKLAQELTATTDAMAKLRIVTQADYTKQMYAGSSIYYNGGGNAAPVPMGSASAGTGTTNNDNSVTLNVPGGIVDSEGLLSTVQEALQRLNKQGSPTYAAGL